MKVKLLRKFRRTLAFQWFSSTLLKACSTSKLSDRKKHFHDAFMHLKWFISLETHFLNSDSRFYERRHIFYARFESYIWRKLDKNTSTFDVLPQGFAFKFKQKYKKHSRKFWTSRAKIRRAIILGAVS